MQPGQLGVEVDALRRVGAQVAEAATILQNTMKAASTGLAPVTESGSAATVAAKTAEGAWLADLRRLTGQIEAFSRDLTQAAQDHQATDEASAEGLRRSVPALPR